MVQEHTFRLKKPQLVRLARRAGTRSITEDGLIALEKHACRLLKKTATKGWVLVDSEKKKTLLARHVRVGCGITMAVPKTSRCVTYEKHLESSRAAAARKAEKEGKEVAKRHAGHGQVAKRQIKYYTRTKGHMLDTPSVLFLIKSVQKDPTTVSVSADALRLLRGWLENCIIELCGTATLIATRSDRSAVKETDLKLGWKLGRSVAVTRDCASTPNTFAGVTQSFKSGIHKFFKKPEKTAVSDDVLEQLDQFLGIVASHVSARAVSISGARVKSDKEHKFTITSDTIMNAFSLVCSNEELDDRMRDFISESVDFFSGYRPNKEHPKSHTELAGLSVSVSRARNVLREHYTGNLSKSAGVALAAGLEAILSRTRSSLKTKSGIKEWGKVIVAPKHLSAVFKKDDILHELSSEIGWKPVSLGASAARKAAGKRLAKE